MDNYSYIFAILPLLFIAAAILKKGEISIWLAIVSCYGFAVTESAPTGWEALSWCTAANSLLIIAIGKHFHSTKLLLPLLMMIVVLIEVILSFGHLIWFANYSVRVPAIGFATGALGYAQLLMVLFMNDKPGALNELVDDCRNLLGSLVHSSGNHKH